MKDSRSPQDSPTRRSDLECLRLTLGDAAVFADGCGRYRLAEELRGMERDVAHDCPNTTPNTTIADLAREFAAEVDVAR